ncbi:hypothetical protein [Acidovorax sp.]|uniref:hypothetical protein n=1 Tax=Acidovorax sp. TaxID=1872122 RepID=UPI00391F92E0
MNTQQPNEFDEFIDAFVDELLATPDDQVLDSLDASAVQTNGLQLLKNAKSQVSRSRLAVARAGFAAMKERPVPMLANVSAAEARQFIAQAANDGQFTMAARNLGELSDEEAIALYSKIKSLENRDGDSK